MPEHTLSLGEAVTLPHQDLLETARLLMAEELQGVASDALAAELLQAVIQHYTVDPEQQAIGAFIQRYDLLPEVVAPWVTALRDRLHRMIAAATGGLIPSFRYQVLFRLTGAEAGITLLATLPTLEDALEHLRNTHEDDYLPARYRR